MTTYPTLTPVETAGAEAFEASFARIFGADVETTAVTPPAIPTARVALRLKPHDGHRRTVTPDSMAEWMRDHPGATRAEMLLEFTEIEIAEHFEAARRIWSRTLAA